MKQNFPTLYTQSSLCVSNFRCFHSHQLKSVHTVHLCVVNGYIIITIITNIMIITIQAWLRFFPLKIYSYHNEKETSVSQLGSYQKKTPTLLSPVTCSSKNLDPPLFPSSDKHIILLNRIKGMMNERKRNAAQIQGVIDRINHLYLHRVQSRVTSPWVKMGQFE